MIARILIALALQAAPVVTADWRLVEVSGKTLYDQQVPPDKATTRDYTKDTDAAAFDAIICHRVA